MKKVAAIFLLGLLILMTGCSSVSEKADVVSLDSHWTAKERSLKSAQFVKTREWAPGQFVVFGETENGKKKSVVRLLLASKTDKGWVYEISTADTKGRNTAIQMLLSGFDKAAATGDASGIKIIWIKILDENGKIQSLEDEFTVGLMQGMYSSAWEKVVNNSTVNKADGGTIVVPAGTFAGTTLIKSSGKIMGQAYTQSCWLHPEIPVNGFVKSISEDGKYTSELLDYGFDGKALIK